MALDISTDPLFAGRITAANAAYPQGSSKNETSPGAGDGTPYVLKRANDIFGLQQALLRSAGITPTGNADTAIASEYLQALIELIMARATQALDSGSALNAYVVTPSANQQGPASLFEGLTFTFTPLAVSTAAVTIDAFGLGAKTLTDSSASVIVVSGVPLTVRYNSGSDEYERSGLESKVDITPEVTIAGQDWDGVSFTDPDAIGANPTAKIYPDGSIVGSTDNGDYTKYPNGDLECRATGIDSPGTWAVPVEFVDTTYSVTSTVVAVGRSEVIGMFIDPAKTTTLITFESYKTGTDVTTVDLDLIAKGRWK